MELMSQLMDIAVVICLFLSRYVSEAAQLCFNCSSVQDPSCRDPFNTKGRVSYTCSPGSSCVKVITGSQVTRGCMATDQMRLNAFRYGEDDDIEKCYKDRVPPSFKARTVCRCYVDLCNPSVPVHVDLRVAVALLVAPLLVWT